MLVILRSRLTQITFPVKIEVSIPCNEFYKSIISIKAPESKWKYLYQCNLILVVIQRKQLDLEYLVFTLKMKIQDLGRTFVTP